MIVIRATRHESAHVSRIGGDDAGLRITRVRLDTTPVAHLVPLADSIIGGWWMKSGGYPVGRKTGSMGAGV